MFKLRETVKKKKEATSGSSLGRSIASLRKVPEEGDACLCEERETATAEPVQQGLVGRGGASVYLSAVGAAGGCDARRTRLSICSCGSSLCLPALWKMDYWERLEVGSQLGSCCVKQCQLGWEESRGVGGNPVFEGFGFSSNSVFS